MAVTINHDPKRDVMLIVSLGFEDEKSISMPIAQISLHTKFSTLVLCQDLVQHKMRNFNYFQLTNSDSLATLAL